MYIVTGDIKWNNTYSGNKRTKPTSEKTMDNRKWCNQDPMNYENRYKSAKADEKLQVKIEEIRDELKKIRNKRW